MNKRKHTHMHTHAVGCLGMHRHTTRAHKCANLSTHPYGNTHMAAYTYVHKDTHTRNFTDSSPYRSYPSLSSSLFFCVHCISPLPLNTPPSVVFFLQGLCFPLPTVMLISAVIRREGLNAAFLTNPLRQTHRAEQSRTERRAHAF